MTTNKKKTLKKKVARVMVPSESRLVRSDDHPQAKIISEFGAEFVGYRGSHHYQASGCWSVMSVAS